MEKNDLSISVWEDLGLVTELMEIKMKVF